MKSALVRRIRALRDGKPMIFSRALINVFGASVRVTNASILGEQVLVSDEEQELRLGICKECEFFNRTTCRKCGCHIRFKAKLQTEHCPIGKW